MGRRFFGAPSAYPKFDHGLVDVEKTLNGPRVGVQIFIGESHITTVASRYLEEDKKEEGRKEKKGRKLYFNIFRKKI